MGIGKSVEKISTFEFAIEHFLDHDYQDEWQQEANNRQADV